MPEGRVLTIHRESCQVYRVVNKTPQCLQNLADISMGMCVNVGFTTDLQVTFDVPKGGESFTGHKDQSQQRFGGFLFTCLSKIYSFRYLSSVYKLMDFSSMGKICLMWNLRFLWVRAG